MGQEFYTSPKKLWIDIKMNSDFLHICPYRPMFQRGPFHLITRLNTPPPPPNSLPSSPDVISAIAIATGNCHSCVIVSDRGVKCWGSIGFWSSNRPVDVPGATRGHIVCFVRHIQCMYGIMGAECQWEHDPSLDREVQPWLLDKAQLRSWGDEM